MPYFSLPDKASLFLVPVGPFKVVFYILGDSLSLSGNVNLPLKSKYYDPGRKN
jgi:hypothetical protein